MKLNYVQNGDCLIPDLILKEADVPPLGKYGRMRKAYIKEHQKALYAALSIKGELFRHCADNEAQARARLAEIIKSQMNTAGVTEALKTSDPLRWAGLMQTIRAQAEEVILQEIIFK